MTTTDHVTETDTTTETETETVTAYVIANLPPCATEGVAITTVAPAGPASSSAASHGSNYVPPSGSSSGSGSSTGSGASPNGASGSKAGTGSNSGSPSGSISGSNPDSSVPIMKPSTPNTVDPNDVNNLHPTPNTTIVLTPGGSEVNASVPHHFAELNVTFQYPTVMLPYSSYVKDFECESYGLDVTFNDLDAYNFAKANWTTYGEKGFLLVTPSLHCNAADDGEHVYWLVHSISFDDQTKTVKVVAEEVAVENAMGEVHIIWGYYTPPGTNPNGPSWNATTPGGAAGSNGGSNSGSGGSGGSGGSTNGTIPTPGHGGPSPGGSSNPGSYTNASCANPPANYKGLPTAPCGPDFDNVLDSKIGFLNFSDPDTLAEFYPGVTPVASNSTKTQTKTQSKRSGKPMEARGWLDAVSNFVGGVSSLEIVSRQADSRLSTPSSMVLKPPTTPFPTSSSASKMPPSPRWTPLAISLKPVWPSLPVSRTRIPRTSTSSLAISSTLSLAPETRTSFTSTLRRRTVRLRSDRCN